jgi:hypothetical protein
MKGRIDKAHYRNVAIRAPQLRLHGLTYKQIAIRLSSTDSTVFTAIRGNHPAWYIKELAAENIKK